MNDARSFEECLMDMGDAASELVEAVHEFRHSDMEAADKEKLLVKAQTCWDAIILFGVLAQVKCND